MRVLTISAHPDDETVGCGGTLLRHAARGDELFWLVVTKACPPQWDEQTVKRKEAEVEQVAGAFGIKRTFLPGMPANRLDSTPINDVVAVVREAVEVARPECVYTVYPGDIHTDHQVVFRAVSIVLKPFHMRRLGVRRILCFETLSSTDSAAPIPNNSFLPTVFHDIGEFLERKIGIMALYETEVQVEPLPRAPSALRALARLRGATVGLEYAEAFALIREIA